MQYKKHVFIHAGSLIELREKSLLVLSGSQQTEEYELHRIIGVFIFGDVPINHQTITSFLLSNTPIAFFDNQGAFIGRLEPSRSTKRNASLKQGGLAPERQLSLSQSLVYAALKQRCQFLKRKVREGNNLMIFIEGFEPVLKRFDPQWPRQHPLSIAEIMGLYGNGMALYWAAFPKISDYFDFDGGRAGSSALNQMLEFAYNLLENYCWNLLLANNLNPLIGVLYSNTQRHPIPALARDIAIEHRFLAEQIILKLVNRKSLTLKDFEDNTLSPAVCKRIVAEFHRKLGQEITFAGNKCLYQQALQLQVEQLKIFYSIETHVYSPILLR
jgi:CRISPR-associated endonuclease Cas1